MRKEEGARAIVLAIGKQGIQQILMVKGKRERHLKK